jgi:hypothetical protein
MALALGKFDDLLLPLEPSLQNSDNLHKGFTGGDTGPS